MAVVIPVAGGLAVAPTMGLAAVVGYRTELPVVLLEAAVMAGTVAGAIVAARRWALAPVLGRPAARPGPVHRNESPASG